MAVVGSVMQVTMWWDTNDPMRRVVWSGGPTVAIERLNEDGLWGEVDPPSTVSVGRSEWFEVHPQDADRVAPLAVEILANKDW